MSNILIGLAFLLGPELNLNLWPSPVGVELKRFIGSIIVANGIGAAMIVRRGTWENARVLMMVALIYGVAVLVMLLYDLVQGNADPFFWLYITADAIFLVPVAYVYWLYERAH
jgi:Ca2+/Na+ antiporter